MTIMMIQVPEPVGFRVGECPALVLEILLPSMIHGSENAGRAERGLKIVAGSHIHNCRRAYNLSTYKITISSIFSIPPNAPWHLPILHSVTSLLKGCMLFSDRSQSPHLHLGLLFIIGGEPSDAHLFLSSNRKQNISASLSLSSLDVKVKLSVPLVLVIHQATLHVPRAIW